VWGDEKTYYTQIGARVWKEKHGLSTKEQPRTGVTSPSGGRRDRKRAWGDNTNVMAFKKSGRRKKNRGAGDSLKKQERGEERTN